MATETTNYKLIKPEQTDYYDVDVFNDNADIVDTALAGKANTTHTHTKNQITDFPTSLKNPTALTINLNGTTQSTYDGSAAKTVTVTPSSIGAAASSHTHDNKDISGFDVGAVLVGAFDTTITDIYPDTSNDYLGSAGGSEAAFVTPDTTPTSGSGKLITSGGVYEALSGTGNILYVKADDTDEQIVSSLKPVGDIDVYSDLATAVNSAYEGCEIVLLPGTYTVSSALTITKSGITIRGLNSALRDKTIINTSVVNAVRLYNSNYILFKDLTFTNVGTTSQGQSIALYNSNHITFENIYLTNTLIFLGFSTPSSTTVTTYEDINILNCKFGTGAGLNFYSNKMVNARILNNYFLSGNNFYLYSQDCIDNSFISGNNVGVTAMN